MEIYLLTISWNFLVPPPSAPIIVGGKDYYNEASILVSCDCLSLDQRPQWSSPIGRISDQSHSTVKKYEKTLCVKTENASMQLEQNIHCNKNNIFDEFKTCLRTKLVGAIQIQILGTVQCSFKSFLENNNFFKRLFPGRGNLSDLYFQHVTASRQPLMDSQQ